MGVSERTHNVDGEPANRRQESLQVVAGEQLGVHAARLFEEGSTERALADAEPLCDAGQVPDVLARDLADVDLNSGIEPGMRHMLSSDVVRLASRLGRRRVGAVLVDPVGRSPDDNLAVDFEFAGSDRFVKVVQLDVGAGDGDSRARVDPGVEVGFEHLRDEVPVRVEGHNLGAVVPRGVVRYRDGRFRVGVVCVNGNFDVSKNSRVRREKWGVRERRPRATFAQSRMSTERESCFESSPGLWLGSICPAAAAMAR